MNDLETLVAFACETAQKAGASDAAAAAAVSRERKVVLRDGSTEEVKAAVSRGLTLKLYVDGRFGSHSTSELDRDALTAFIDRAVALTRLLEPDEHRRLPDPSLYEGRSQVDLQLADPGFDGFSPEERLKRAWAAHDAAKERAGDTALSIGASAADGYSYSVLHTTNGFHDAQAGTGFHVSAQVTVTDPSGRRPGGHDYDGARLGSSALDAERIGRRAAEHALSRVGEGEIESVTLPIIVENRVVGRLLGSMLGPLSGAALDQRRSCWEGRMGEQIAASALTITDDPFIPAGWGSRRYNGEGLTTRQRPIIEGGVLKTWFIDTYYGRKLGMAPTGGWNNLVFDLGDQDLDAMCREAGDAILITGFLGGNSNGTTGDFSHGFEGFLIEGGERSRPISGMNIAGNHTELWKTLEAVGNDAYLLSSVRSPSLRFAPMVVAGR